MKLGKARTIFQGSNGIDSRGQKRHEMVLFGLETGRIRAAIAEKHHVHAVNWDYPQLN